MTFYTPNEALRKKGLLFATGMAVAFTVVGAVLGNLVSNVTAAGFMVLILLGLCAGISVRFGVTKAYAAATGSKWTMAGKRWSIIWRALLILLLARIILALFIAMVSSPVGALIAFLIVFFAESACGCYLGMWLGDSQPRPSATEAIS